MSARDQPGPPPRLSPLQRQRLLWRPLRSRPLRLSRPLTPTGADRAEPSGFARSGATGIDSRAAGAELPLQAQAVRGDASMAGSLLSRINLARAAQIAALLLFLLPWATVSCSPRTLAGTGI